MSGSAAGGRGQRAPERDAAIGDGGQMAGERGPHHAMHAADDRERLAECLGPDRDVAGGAEGGEGPEPVDAGIFKNDYLHGKSPRRRRWAKP